MDRTEREQLERETEEARWERNLKLSVEERLNQGTVRPHRPGIDDGTPFRSFVTMADYKAWCETLPKWLGYGRAEPEGEERGESSAAQGGEHEEEQGEEPQAS